MTFFTFFVYFVIVFLLMALMAFVRMRPLIRSDRAGRNSGRYAEMAKPWLLPGEEVLFAAIAIPAAGASGMRPTPGLTGLAGEAGHQVGNRLGRIGAVSGGQQSIAMSMPATKGGKLLVLTESRLLLIQLHPGLPRQLLWAVPRTACSTVSARPRLQLMARFRLEFADKSSAAMLTPSGETIKRLQATLA